MFVFFFFKQKTAYEMRISDWSSDVCSSDLANLGLRELTACIRAWQVRDVLTDITTGFPGSGILSTHRSCEQKIAMRAAGKATGRGDGIGLAGDRKSVV